MRSSARAAALLGGLLGCSCSDAVVGDIAADACVDGLSLVSFAPSLTAGGTYEVELVVGGTSRVCTAVLDAQGWRVSGPDGPTCRDDQGSVLVIGMRDTEPTENGAGRGPHGITGLQWRGLDAAAQITVRKDGAELKSGTVSLQSETACEGGENRRGSFAVD